MKCLWGPILPQRGRGQPLHPIYPQQRVTQRLLRGRREHDDVQRDLAPFAGEPVLRNLELAAERHPRDVGQAAGLEGFATTLSLGGGRGNEGQRDQGQDGCGRQKKERTEWHRIVLWGKVAEALQSYLTKGRQLYVEGRLQTRKWQDKDGNDRYTTEINAQTVQLLGKGKDDRQPEPVAAGAEPAPAAHDEDDIPF